jgi:hypothetical protein
MFAIPAWVGVTPSVGPVPPCILQRLMPFAAGDWYAAPAVELVAKIHPSMPLAPRLRDVPLTGEKVTCDFPMLTLTRLNHHQLVGFGL